MKKTTLILLLSLPFITLAQVGIGTMSPNTSSLLELKSNDKGLLVPRMSESQRIAINPALAITFPTNSEESTKGLLVYQTNNVEGFYYFDGTIWQAIGGPADKDYDWTIVGDDMYNANPGNVGVGVIAPVAKFHVKGTTNLGSTSGPTLIIDDSFEDNTLSPFTSNSPQSKLWIVDNVSASTTTDVFSCSSANNLGDGEECIIQLITPVLTVPGQLTFDFFTKTESCCDKLYFEIVGVASEDQEWSGTNDWTPHTLTLAPGSSYTLKWKYKKDGSVSPTNDLVRIDNVKLTGPNSTPILGSYVLRLEESTQQDGYVLVSDADGNSYWDDVANATPEGLQNLSLSGLDLSIIDANTVDLSPLFTDDQKVEKLNLTSSDFLEIAIEDDDVADETIDLFSLIGTDNQTIDEFKLTGSILSLSLLNDGFPPLTLDIASALLSQYDFENALKKVANDVKLGGPLTQNTSIDVNNKNFLLQGDNKNIFEANGDKDFIMFGGATAVPYTNFSFSKPADGDIYNDTFGRDYRIDIVAGFRSRNGIIDAEGGSAIQIGDEEFIVDGKEELMVNSNFSSLFNDNFGTDTFKWTEVYTVNGVNSTSDMTLKSNVKKLNRGLKEILDLSTITYQWKDNKKGARQSAGNSNERKIGFSAQQLQTKIPEVVNTHSWVPADEKGNYKYKKNKNLGVFYNDLIPVQVKAIQEQQEEIKELELLITNLENTLNSIKSK